MSLFIFFFCLLIAGGSAQTVVTGRVTGVDGEPIIKANVLLKEPFDTTVVKAVDVGREGEFRIVIPSDGIWMLVARGVHHAEHTVAIYVDRRESISVNISLAAYTYLNNFNDVKAIGNFNNWYDLSAVPLRKQPDGTYAATIKTKARSVTYRLLNVREGGSIEGTQADRYSYNWSQGYVSVIGVKNGAARIIFDPSKLVRSEKPTKVEFVNAPRVVGRFNEIYEQRVEFQNTFRAAFRAHMRSRGRTEAKVDFDMSGAISSIKKQLETEKEVILRRELYLNYISLYVMSQRIDAPFYTTVLKEIPANSIIWSLEPNSIFFALTHSDLTDQQKNDYVSEVIAKNPIKRVKSLLVFDEFMASKMMADNERTAHYYDILVKEFGDTPEARHVARVYTRPSTPSEKKTVPTFSVVSLDNSARLITDKSLRGKYCLIFFWAAEDPGSVEQVSYLQKAYDAYSGRKFEILTLSVDSSYTDVLNFRKGKWKMPWMNAYLGRNIDNKVVKAFRAYHIPMAFLVDPKGTIIAEGKDLLGSQLHETLRKYLGK